MSDALWKLSENCEDRDDREGCNKIERCESENLLWGLKWSLVPCENCVKISGIQWCDNLLWGKDFWVLVKTVWKLQEYKSRNLLWGKDVWYLMNWTLCENFKDEVVRTYYEERMSGALKNPILCHRVLHLILLDNHLHKNYLYSFLVACAWTWTWMWTWTWTHDNRWQ